MSQDRPPWPIQPRVVSNTAYDTAQVQREALSGASYLGRAGSRNFQSGSFLSSVSRYTEQLHDQHRHTLAPLQLPTNQKESAQYDAVYPDRPLEFADILSSAPSRQRPREPQSTSRTQHAGPPVHSSYARRAEHNQDEKYGPFEAGAKVWHPPHRPRSQHYAPSGLLTSQFTFQQGPEVTQSHPRMVPSHPEPDRYVGSPATTIGSFARSHYSGSSEQSPSAESSSVQLTVADTILSQPPVPPPLDYHLSIRQQPIAARACGYGERDRRVIDPPPILELKITDKATGAPEQDPNAMLALHCTLLSTDGKEGETSVDTTLTDSPNARRLMGTLVASPYQAKDEYGVAGTFFVFSDLSCRQIGTFKLEFRMLRVNPLFMQPGAKHGCVASIETNVFTVYTAKVFPGMRASSALLMALRSQGLAVGLKKGTEARIAKGKKRHPSDSSDEDDGGSESESDEPVSSKPSRPTSDDMTTPTSRTKAKSKQKKSAK